MMNKIDLVVVVVLVAFIAMLSGVLIFNKILTNECVQIVKDKPAAEIRIICE